MVIKGVASSCKYYERVSLVVLPTKELIKFSHLEHRLVWMEKNNKSITCSFNDLCQCYGLRLFAGALVDNT